MTKRHVPRPDEPSFDLLTLSFRHREDEILDAIVTGAALVARADGWIDPVERGQLLDFLDRTELLSIFRREDILERFERCVRGLREPGGLSAAVERLQRHAGRSLAQLVVDLGQEIAAADCRLDPREQQILVLMRSALRAPAAARRLRRLRARQVR